MRRLMCITAHPDDEAANFGGSLRLYHDRGVETCVLCLTPGQAARNRGNAKEDHELAAIRRNEFAASCEILKITRGVVLNYLDGHLHQQDLYKIVCDVTRLIREFRPQVILTFGPEGGLTAHMDHSMASVFATLAFHWAARSNRYPDHLADGLKPHRTQKLYYSTSAFQLDDREPVSPAPETTAIDIGPYLETKIEAFGAHKTQAPLLDLFRDRISRGERRELFHLVANAHAVMVERETDLFAGVSDGE